MSEPSSSSRIGFRRWHQQQLFASFAWLVTCLLSGLAIGAILELIGISTPGFTPLITLVVVYVIGLMAITAFRRFWSLLSHAQDFADKATCDECGAYGLFDVFTDEIDPMPAICRQCGHRWTIR